MKQVLIKPSQQIQKICTFPDIESSTTIPCEDNWSAKRCNRKMLKGNCARENVAANCQLTCGLCGVFTG